MKHPLAGAWAIAVLFLREVRRRRGFPVFVAGLLVVALFAPRLGGGLDLVSRLELAVQYGVGIPVILLGVATLVLSTGSLGHEIERREVHLLVARPIARWQVLLGKLLGVVVLDAGLLALVVAVFLLHVVLLWSPAPQSERERSAVRFFTSRRSVVSDRFEQPRLEAEQAMSVVFSGLASPRDTSDEILLRFRLDAVPRLSTPSLDVEWTDTTGERFRRRVRAARGRAAVVEVPGGLVGEDGRLALVLRNAHDAGSGVRFVVSPERFEALEAAGGFWATLALAAVLVILQLGFLAAVGVFGGALFSLPTAALAGGFVYLVGLSAPYLREALEFALTQAGGEPGGWSSAAARLGWLLEGIFRVLPDLTGDDPLRCLVDARALSWSDLAWRYGGALVLRAGAIFAAAAWLWRRRDLGSLR